ncbi:long-chain-fatty-acid--CoA ligase [Nocardioides sp. Bht2]|uniref:long-chain-fatty-acid--CoA ligase n=1 Tax=Nocardioides sp. Bht2 TaxID=3392297 RepID=UPI0039B3BE3B
MTNLAHHLSESAERFATRPAVRLDALALDYASLEAATARMAGLLTAHGLRPGDRVAVMLPNVPYFPIAYYGILRAGGVVVPMNVLLKERETSFYLRDSGAAIIVAWHDFAAAAQHGADEAGATCITVRPGDFEAQLAGATPTDAVVERADDDTAVILYTSGTTGTPKGAELSHANLRGNARTVVEMLSLDSTDVVLGALPLFHSFGQTCGLNASVAAGACLTLIPRFEPDAAIAMLDRDQVTVFEGVPTMFAAMLHSAARPANGTLRLCVSGGAAMPGEVMRGFEAAFGGEILEGYGLSETSPVSAFNQPGRPRKVGSIGTPVADVEMRLLNVSEDGIGEIAVRGPNVMKGYWQRPDATAEVLDADGWLSTGDLAKVDEDGYYFIVDRSKDLIIRGGYNVYPREVEEVLYEHPAVREAAVIGVPDEMLGEEVVAVLGLVAGATADAEEIRGWVKEQVAAYKYPRHVLLVDELPKGPTGKILKREIAVTLP